MVGVPFPKTHQFEMGNKTAQFDKILYLLVKESAQIRDNSLEAARVVANKFLDTKIGEDGYFMKILKYPHHVLREKPIATGAGADRYSQGMAHAFGKPVGTAIQITKGERLIQLRLNKNNLEIGKKALKKFGMKITTTVLIAVEE